MELINLRLLEELRREALALKQIAVSYCYHFEGDADTISDEIFTKYMKAYFQANNLTLKLEEIRSLCMRYAAGSFPRSSAECKQNGDPLDNAKPDPEPFVELQKYFCSERVHDLPERIEQYDELWIMAKNFSLIQTRRRDYFKGEPERSVYLRLDEVGNPVAIPPGKLNPDAVAELVVSREAVEMSVETSLDYYNTFFEVSLATIETYGVTGMGTIQECAVKILDLLGIDFYSLKNSVNHALN